MLQKKRYHLLASVKYLAISIVQHLSISSYLHLLHRLTVQLSELLQGAPGNLGCWVGGVQGSGDSLRSSSVSESRSSILKVSDNGSVLKEQRPLGSPVTHNSPNNSIISGAR